MEIDTHGVFQLADHNFSFGDVLMLSSSNEHGKISCGFATLNILHLSVEYHGLNIRQADELEVASIYPYDSDPKENHLRRGFVLSGRNGQGFVSATWLSLLHEGGTFLLRSEIDIEFRRNDELSKPNFLRIDRIGPKGIGMHFLIIFRLLKSGDLPSTLRGLEIKWVGRGFEHNSQSYEVHTNGKIFKLEAEGLMIDWGIR